MKKTVSSHANEDTRLDKRQTILIIDDDQDWASLLKAHFSDNYEVEVANHPSDAIELVQTHQPDLIILDLVMPSMDGFGLIHRFNEIKKGRLCVILLTGWKTQEVEECAASIGCAAVLGKPISLGELSLTVSELLGENEVVEVGTDAARSAATL